MMNPPLGTARTLATLLAAGEQVGVSHAVRLVQNLAGQAAESHARGVILRAINPATVTVDADWTPSFVEPATGHELPAEVRQYLPPELATLPINDLPADIAAAARKLTENGISLDPRQIDIYSLGALLCRLTTGESAAAYLRSPRVKRNMPPALRVLVERALGTDGHRRFADVMELSTALDCDMEAPLAATSDAAPVTDDARAVQQSFVPTGDTTPSFVRAEDTKTWIGQGTATDQSTGELPFTQLGHYHIVGRIGHGGMGDVYQGYETGLDRKVAIKVLPAELARQSDFIRRFKTEATSAAKVIHPNILQIYFIGEDAGHHFFAMQYVEGESLAELLARRGRLKVEETLPIIEQALAGLAAAHKQGLIHRDIKPANILLDREHRRALLADFGLVKAIGTSGTGHTATGVVMGTVDYISPEQGRGKTVDYRSDLYSLGILLYQMLSGRLPFDADSPTALIFQHVYEQPPPLREAAQVPEQLASIVARLLRKSPADRYQSVDEILSDLRAFRAGQPLPSGADRQPWQDVGARSPRSSIIFAPTTPKADDAALSAELASVKAPDWWERTGGRAKSLFWRHAPEAIQRLQNTQQQVDGAIARYARQERELRKLANEAEAVLADLQTQAREHRSAAEASRQQADRTTETTAIHATQAAEIAANQMATELDRQANEQQDQLGSIKLRLAQIVSKRRELENQRDILYARLKLAGVRVAVEGGLVPKSKTAGRLMAGTIAVVVCAVAAFGYFNWPRPDDSYERYGESRGLSSGSKSNRPTTDRGHQTLIDVTPFELRALSVRNLSTGNSSGLFRGASFAPNSQLTLLSPNAAVNYELGTWAPLGNQPFQMNLQTTRIILSLDRKWMASGTAGGGQVELSDAESGRLLRSSPPLGQSIKTLAFSPDGKVLAAVHVDQDSRGTLKLWNTSDMQQARAIPNANADIQSVAFDPQGRLLAYGTVKGTIHLLDASTLKPIHDLQGHGQSVGALTFGPDGRTLVSGDKAGDLVLWDAKSGQQLGTFDAHLKGIETLALAPDGRHLASSDVGGTLVWDMSVGVVRAVCFTHGVTELAFDPETRYLATVEIASGQVEIWNTRFPIEPLWRDLRDDGTKLNNLSEVSLPPVVLKGKDLILASGSTAYLYDAQVQNTSARFKGHTSEIRAMALSGDGSTLATGAADGSVRFWKTVDGETTATLSIPIGDDGSASPVKSLALTRDGQLAAVTTTRGLFILEPGGKTKVSPLDVSITPSSAAWSASADKQLLLVSGTHPHTMHPEVVVWDFAGKKVQAQAGPITQAADWLAPAQGGATFVCGSIAGLRLYSTSDGHLIRGWKVPELESPSFTMLANGESVAVVNGNDIGIWDLNSARETLHLHRGTPGRIVKYANFSQDGRTLMFLDDQAYIGSEPLDLMRFEISGYSQSLLNGMLKELQGHWNTTSLSPASQHLRLQGLQLDQNPLLKLQGPTADLDLANFATDGGWWVNHGALVRQPRAQHLIVDIGEYLEFHLQTRLELGKSQRIFFIFGWDGQRGHCLASPRAGDAVGWTLTSFPSGASQQLTLPVDPAASASEDESYSLRFANNELTFTIGGPDNTAAPGVTRSVADGRRGRLLMGVIDGNSGGSPVRILSTSVTQY